MKATYSYRVKNCSGHLAKQARAVNFVWNYCNDVQKHAVRWQKKRPTHFDLVRMTSGAAEDLPIGSNTVSETCRQFVNSVKHGKRPNLRYRGRHNLGWVPVRGCDLKPLGGAFRVYGQTFRVFSNRLIPEGAKIKDGSNFAQDAKGNWFLNIVLELPDVERRPVRSAIGIDLGLKELATLSTGEKIENPRHFRQIEERLGKAQRANKKRLARNLHMKAKRARADFLHKQSRRLVEQFDFIAVGDVGAARLKKTRLGKSVSDAGWTSFRNMLRYKAIAHGAAFEEVSEYLSTRVCSSCASETGPKGVADLGIRQWCCSECGAVHDRDHNSAINILVRSGHRTLVEGIAA